MANVGADGMQRAWELANPPELVRRLLDMEQPPEWSGEGSLCRAPAVVAAPLSEVRVVRMHGGITRANGGGNMTTATATPHDHWDNDDVEDLLSSAQDDETEVDSDHERLSPPYTPEMVMVGMNDRAPSSPDDGLNVQNAANHDDDASSHASASHAAKNDYNPSYSRPPNEESNPDTYKLTRAFLSYLRSTSTATNPEEKEEEFASLWVCFLNETIDDARKDDAARSTSTTTNSTQIEILSLLLKWPNSRITQLWAFMYYDHKPEYLHEMLTSHAQMLGENSRDGAIARAFERERRRRSSESGVARNSERLKRIRTL